MYVTEPGAVLGSHWSHHFHAHKRWTNVGSDQALQVGNEGMAGARGSLVCYMCVHWSPERIWPTRT